MISDYGLRHVKEETNSVKELLTLQSFDEIGGNSPLHLIHVSRFYWLLSFLIAWAWGFQVGLRPLVWVADWVLASMGSAVTGSVWHGNV